MLNNENPLLAAMHLDQLMVRAGGEDWVTSCLNAVVKHPDFAKVTSAETMTEMVAEGFWPEAGSWMAYFRPYNVKDGTLQIPIKGMLMNNFPFSFGDWATGYEYIWEAWKRGQADEGVKRIVLLIDSGGGMVAGNFDLVDRMFADKGNKPTAAVLSEHAYSAAYSLASVADTIYMPRTGGAGSIGVVTMWVGRRKQLEEMGVEVKFIHAGEHKVDGNPYADLTADVTSRIQKRIDNMYNIFTTTVARNRNISEEAVRGTKALCFIAPDAVANGLADKILAPEDAVNDFANGTQTEAEGSDEMTISKEEHEKAVATARTEAAAEAATAATAAERARIGEILGHAEAEGRSAMASHIAFNTSMSTADAAAMLAAAPKEAAQAATPAPVASQDTAFQSAMATTPNPEVPADSASEQGSDDDDLAGAFYQLSGLKKQ